MDTANEPGQPPVTSSARSLDLPTPTCALAVGAHPDDIEFGAGATLAKWAAQGCVVHHIVCTDGSKGTWDVTADLGRLVALRRDEQREAARRLGATGEVVFLDQVDGELENTRWLRDIVARWIRVLQPEVVLTHDPWKRYRLHPDHRHAGQIVCDAIVAARDPHFFPEHGVPHHRPETLLMWEADTVHHVEDVTDFVEVKLQALAAHASQFESTMKATDDQQLAAFDAKMRSRLTELGEAHGVGAAEVFARISDL
jgi:LmbE family N-acetylglucosaminyl deacetylase